MEEQKAHTLESTQDAYRKLLESGVSTKVFYAKMIEFTYQDPYFFAPYIEILDYLDSVGLEDEKKALLENIYKRLVAPLVRYALLKEVHASWGKEEVVAYKKILARLRAVYPYAWRPFILALFAKAADEHVSTHPESRATNLVLMKSGIDVSSMQKEIEVNEVCWTFDTTRQDTILAHQETNAIILRTLTTKDGVPIKPEGNLHESTKTPLADLFPSILEVVEGFANERGASLGRVALVRLKPHAKVYRHYDSESWLQGRNRYHLVVQSRGGSYMTSGIESALFNEGDIFFFDNKKMHTAENNSDDWRVHVIFDMHDTRALHEA